MSISMDDVRALRDQTGAGVLDCKRTLEECKGDMQAALNALREKGLAKAVKKGERETREGIVALAVSADQKKAALLRVHCETDFVAKTELFQGFADMAVQYALEGAFGASPEALSEALSEKRLAAIAKLGENVSMGACRYLEAQGSLFPYMHLGKVGTVVDFVGTNLDKVTDTLKQIAMQIASMNPQAVSREDLPKELLEQEKTLYWQKARESGKPDHILETIVNGQMDKFCQEQALLEQHFILDEDKSMQQILDALAKTTGNPVTIRQFIRLGM